jgi:hypothetical protein
MVLVIKNVTPKNKIKGSKSGKIVTTKNHKKHIKVAFSKWLKDLQGHLFLLVCQHYHNNHLY